MCSSPQPGQVQQDAGRSKERRAVSAPMCARKSYLPMHLVGKSVPVKRLQQKNKLFENGAKVFLWTNSDHQMIAATGEKLLVDIYNGNDGDTLDKLRLVKYHQKVSTGSKQVQPKVLPPTSAAAKYHSYRVSYQVQEWACLGTSLELMPEEWGEGGLQLQRRQLLPDISPVPEELLNVIRCGCTTDCSSHRCSCRKVGLSCTTACEQCRGTSCLNSMLPMDEEEEEPNLWGRTSCRTDSDLYWLVRCTSDSVIQGFALLWCISSSGTPLPRKKIIAKTFLLNISSAFHQK